MAAGPMELWAVELEGVLHRQLPRMHVWLLGRFDRVEIASSLDEPWILLPQAISYARVVSKPE